MTPCGEHRTCCTAATVFSSPEFWCCPQLDWSFMRMQRLRRCELQWAFYNTPRSNIGLRTRANTCDANTCTGNYDRCLHLLWRFAHHDLWHQACGLLYSGRKWIVKSTTVFILAYDMPTILWADSLWRRRSYLVDPSWGSHALCLIHDRNYDVQSVYMGFPSSFSYDMFQIQYNSINRTMQNER